MKKTPLQLRQMLSNARQPVVPQPVVIPDWPLDRRRLQAEQGLDLPAPEQGLMPGTDEPITHRPLAGARPNNRGMGVDILPGDGTKLADPGRPRDPVIVFEYPKRSGEDAEDMTIVIGFTPKGDPDSIFGPILLRGFLDFGIGGVTFSAKFDIIQGQIIQVPSSWARIRAAYDVEGDGSPPQPPVFVTAGAAYYTHGNRNAPRFTQRLPTIDGGASSLTQVIPPFASAFSIKFPNLTTPNLSILVDDSAGGGATFQYTDNSNRAIQENTFPLSGADRYIVVANNDNANPVDVSIVYYLAF